MRGFRRFLWLLSFIASLMGCAGDARIFSESLSAIRQTDKFNDVAKTASMFPMFAYLRVHSERGATLLLWTFVDVDPLSNLPIDIWQSGSREIIKMQNGRVVASDGLVNDWLMARYQGVPDWTQMTTHPNQNIYHYQRVVDRKTSYQFGKLEQLSLTRVPQPTGHGLAGVQQPSIVWFEEKILNSELPPSIYGVVPNWNKSGQAKVLYTWHCFQMNECMGFQVWTTIDQEYLKAHKP